MKYHNYLRPVKRFERASRGRARDPKDWAMDCLKKPGTGYREGKERKEITLRAVKFNPSYRSSLRSRLNLLRKGDYVRDMNVVNCREE